MQPPSALQSAGTPMRPPMRPPHLISQVLGQQRAGGRASGQARLLGGAGRQRVGGEGGRGFKVDKGVGGPDGVLEGAWVRAGGGGEVGCEYKTGGVDKSRQMPTASAAQANSNPGRSGCARSPLFGGALGGLVLAAARCRRVGPSACFLELPVAAARPPGAAGDALAGANAEQ